MGAINISVPFDDEEVYNNTVLPLKQERNLTKVVRTLLELYHYNPSVRTLVTGSQVAEDQETMDELNAIFDSMQEKLEDQEFVSESLKEASSGTAEQLSGFSAREERSEASSKQANAAFEQSIQEKLQHQENRLDQKLSEFQANITSIIAQAMAGQSAAPVHAPAPIPVVGVEVAVEEEEPLEEDFAAANMEEPKEEEIREATSILSNLKFSL